MNENKINFSEWNLRRILYPYASFLILDKKVSEVQMSKIKDLYEKDLFDF